MHNVPLFRGICEKWTWPRGEIAKIHLRQVFLFDDFLEFYANFSIIPIFLLSSFLPHPDVLYMFFHIYLKTERKRRLSRPDPGTPRTKMKKNA